MARAIETQTTCDMDGAVGASPYPLSAHSEIDLCEGCKETLFDLLEPYIAKSRPVRRTGKRTQRPKAPTTNAREVRAWARTAGVDVSDRGRVSAKVVEEYRAAQA